MAITYAVEPIDYAEKLWKLEQLKHKRKMLEPSEQWGNEEAADLITKINTQITTLLEDGL